MEQVVKIFQQRLFQLTKTFLRLLDNIEKSKLFTLSASHCQYRLEYLGHMILTTLQNQQQKTIKKLTERIQFLTQESGLTSQSRFYNINLEIPQIFARQVQKRDKMASKTQTTTPLSSSPQTRNPSPIKILQKNTKNTSETKMNSFEQTSSQSQQKNEQSLRQSDQSVMSYKFKYLNIKL